MADKPDLRKLRPLEGAEQATILKMRQALEAVDGYVLRVDSLKGAARGSPAAQSAKRTFGNLHSTFAVSALANGLDHLRAWSLILNGPDLPVSGFWALIRGGMEGAATCRWLVDPNVHYTERIRRGAVMQLDDWRERERFERSIGIGIDKVFPEGAGRSGAYRLATHVDRMRRAGLIAPDQDPRRVTAESITNLMRAYGSEPLWRMASGFAHSSPWTGMLQELNAVTGMTVEGSRQVLLSANVDYAYVGTLSALKTAREALEEVEAHYRPRGSR